jgi:hypothetical protein
VQRPLTPESIWWERVHRAAAKKGPVSRTLADWCHEVLRVLSAEPDPFQLGEGGWVPMPAELCTDEFKGREILRLCDELGRSLGVGEYPSREPKPIKSWYAISE